MPGSGPLGWLLCTSEEPEEGYAFCALFTAHWRAGKAPTRTIRNFQGGFCSLALGTAGLGACLAMFLKLLAPSPWARTALGAQCLCTAFAAIPLAAFSIKALRFPAHFRRDLDTLEHPSGALVSSGAMAVAPMARCLHALGCEQAARGVWIFGLALHVGFMGRLFVTALRMGRRSLLYATPSWFVVYVGVAVYAAVATTMDVPRPLVKASLWLGIFNLVWELPLVTWRLAVLERIPRAAYPNYAIYMAPSSLCCAAWLTTLRADRGVGVVYGNLPPAAKALTAALAALACATAVPVFLRYKQFFVKGPVLPGWASFTFPTVIFANAMGRLCLLCPTARVVLAPLAWAACANATLVVVNVWVGFARLWADGALSHEYLPLLPAEGAAAAKAADRDEDAGAGAEGVALRVLEPSEDAAV